MRLQYSRARAHSQVLQGAIRPDVIFDFDKAISRTHARTSQLRTTALTRIWSSATLPGFFGAYSVVIFILRSCSMLIPRHIVPKSIAAVEVRTVHEGEH